MFGGSAAAPQFDRFIPISAPRRPGKPLRLSSNGGPPQILVQNIPLEFGMAARPRPREGCGPSRFRFWVGIAGYPAAPVVMQPRAPSGGDGGLPFLRQSDVQMFAFPDRGLTAALAAISALLRVAQASSVVA